MRSTDNPNGRVASRLLLFVFDLLRHHGVDPDTRDIPAWVAWSDYIAAIHRLGEVAGGPAGVAAAMRATLSTAYSELRALAGFFAGPIPFFSFVTHHLMRELVPGADGRVEVLSERDLRVRYRIDDSLEGSLLYLQGTVTLVEVFPTHFGLPEAKVEVLAITDRTADLAATFPEATTKAGFGDYLPTRSPLATNALTQREQEVLHLVCEGLTNAEIATALGTAASTVKSQISSILMKMDVANRTELAARASRRS